MQTQRIPFQFQGAGDRAELEHKLESIRPFGGQIGPWRRWPGDEGVTDHYEYPEHPANYRGSEALVDAVNTAIAIGKPLLVTGNPGTGKSQLAERIAWEFNLGPVLRFEAQSLSEANDLFYRFDLVGYLAAVRLYQAAMNDPSNSQLAEHLRSKPRETQPENFVKMGPLGEAILRSRPNDCRRLFDAALAPEQASAATPRPSVVLIDEIDKASRDFPNDLLNGIDRLEFTVREFGLGTMTVAQDLRPIVIITSNSERDLPPAFLRRCTFFHIDDPLEPELAQIIAQKFFRPRVGDGSGKAGKAELPPFYRQLLAHFMEFREANSDDLQYRPGTAEIINWTDALLRRRISGEADMRQHLDVVKLTTTTVAKHKDDQQSLIDFLTDLEPAKA